MIFKVGENILEQFENKRSMGHIAQLKNMSSIKTFAHSYEHTILLINIISFLRIEWSFFVKSWIPVTKQRMHCAKVVWNWPREEEDFEISSIYIRYFVVSPWLKSRSFIWIPFTLGCCVQSLVRISQVAPENIFFRIC